MDCLVKGHLGGDINNRWLVHLAQISASHKISRATHDSHELILKSVYRDLLGVRNQFLLLEQPYFYSRDPPQKECTKSASVVARRRKNTGLDR